MKNYTKPEIEVKQFANTDSVLINTSDKYISRDNFKNGANTVTWDSLPG